MGLSKADVCVIFNARAGSGHAARQLHRLRRVLSSHAEFRGTTGRGHAEELARAAAEEGFAIVAAAGGDGTVHEVGNGLLRSGRTEVILAVLPVGSANDYAHGLGLDADWWTRPGPVVTTPLDVGLARGSDGREEYFINNLGIGLTAAVALEAEQVPLRGLARYMVGLIRTICFRYQSPPATVTLDGQTSQGPTLALSLGNGTREGNFSLVPHALFDDGLLDYVHVRGLTRTGLVRLVPAAVMGRLPTDHPQLSIGRCRHAVIESTVSLAAHADGEFFCRPEEDIRRIEVEVLPRRLRVMRRATG